MSISEFPGTMNRTPVRSRRRSGQLALHRLLLGLALMTAASCGDEGGVDQHGHWVRHPQFSLDKSYLIGTTVHGERLWGDARAGQLVEVISPTEAIVHELPPGGRTAFGGSMYARVTYDGAIRGSLAYGYTSNPRPKVGGALVSPSEESRYWPGKANGDWVELSRYHLSDRPAAAFHGETLVTVVHTDDSTDCQAWLLDFKPDPSAHRALEPSNPRLVPLPPPADRQGEECYPESYVHPVADGFLVWVTSGLFHVAATGSVTRVPEPLLDDRSTPDTEYEVRGIVRLKGDLFMAVGLGWGPIFFVRRSADEGRTWEAFMDLSGTDHREFRKMFACGGHLCFNGLADIFRVDVESKTITELSTDEMPTLASIVTVAEFNGAYYAAAGDGELYVRSTDDSKQ